MEGDRGDEVKDRWRAQVAPRARSISCVLRVEGCSLVFTGQVRVVIIIIIIICTRVSLIAIRAAAACGIYS